MKNISAECQWHFSRNKFRENKSELMHISTQVAKEKRENQRDNQETLATLGTQNTRRATRIHTKNSNNLRLWG